MTIILALVETIEQIKDNIKTLDSYFKRSTDYQGYALDKVKKGTCFVAMKTADGLKFYPSKFIGYVNNSMSEHENAVHRDGRITNRAITKILRTKLRSDDLLEQQYIEYCYRLGFDAYKKGHRKYWLLEE